MLLAAAATAGASFLLGLAALSGGIRSVWIVLGLTFGAISVGSAFIARWRVGAVRRHVPELVSEVRSLIDQGGGAARTVIDTVEAGEANQDGSVLTVSRQMFDFKGAIGDRVNDFTKLTAAVAAVTSFPALILSAIGITFVFGFLGLIFLIALAL